MVVLGVVKEGTVRAYDELALARGGKKILVKSIQDARRPCGQLFKPIKGRPCTQRRDCGRHLRGDVICVPDAVRVSSGAIPVKFAEPILQG
jgi:hypothetical protein